MYYMAKLYFVFILAATRVGFAGIDARPFMDASRTVQQQPPLLIGPIPGAGPQRPPPPPPPPTPKPFSELTPEERAKIGTDAWIKNCEGWRTSSSRL